MLLKINKALNFVYYTSIACITIDSVLRIDKKNYLEECRYWAKKPQMSKFINTELKSDSESSDSPDFDSEKIGPKIDKELIAKLKESGCNSELDILLIIFADTFLLTSY